ncbi:hypothetical protein EVAR_82887_1 [Eumeta japonica]|uniref:Uncharacterized protein n=1 Tax=Eumeta variegata TaxID=151549 RepID=A0A4C1YLB7_EUMVA|nr:hypothetical protein EVAR_82887_1 [Eumeta japonica]
MALLQHASDTKEKASKREIVTIDLWPQVTNFQDGVGRARKRKEWEGGGSEHVWQTPRQRPLAQIRFERYIKDGGGGSFVML